KFSMIVRHLKPLVNTWALIQRPDDIRINPNQPLNFKKIDLSCKKHDGKVAESICEGHYDKFDLKGKYIISFYVNDIRGDISTPETIDINQTQGKAVISVQYDEQQAIVYLRDVIVGGKHKQAALKQQGDKFVAFAINDAETEFSPAASFDTILNQLIIPHVLVLGENYKVTFNYLGGLNFQLQSITPK
ncbi:MAG: hypothetical protein KAG45_11190, partial [Methyloprofundus sp.]|nr:hypothetical protein [Methyloprofundus sp.]